MSRSVVQNAASRDQVKRATRREKTREQRRAERWRTLLSTYLGREHVWEDDLGQGDDETVGPLDIIRGPMEIVYADTAVANDKRRLMAYLMREHTEAFLQMQAEAMARTKQTDAALADAQQADESRRTEETPETE